MVNIRKFETEKEKNNRERRENIVKDYWKSRACLTPEGKRR